MRLLLLSTVLVLSLTGCRLWDPTFMPAGYTHHQGTYKSPPGTKAPGIGYDYSAAENEEHLIAWRHALRDLLLKARAHNIDLPETVMLTTDLDHSAFQSSYDYILREGLRAYGHILSPSSEEGALFYSAYNVERDRAIRSTQGHAYNGNMSPHDRDVAFSEFGSKTVKMELVIGILEESVLVKQVRGIYELPVDGFTPGSYVSGHNNPLKQKPTKRCPFICADEDQ